jgi:hypothetical protein
VRETVKVLIDTKSTRLEVFFTLEIVLGSVRVIVECRFPENASKGRVSAVGGHERARDSVLTVKLYLKNYFMTFPTAKYPHW